MTDATGRRFCPVCGNETTAQFCPNDRTPTVVTQGFAKHPRSYEVGDIVAGRYQITGALGAGGFAAVYSAEHMGTAQEVAVKLMAFDMAGSNGEIAVRRFFREARTTAALKHPNTVRVFDVGQDEQGPLFIAMEVLRGESLEDLMKRRFGEGRQLSEKETLDIAIQTLASLNEAHEKGLVHRDLKPGNIYLAEQASGPPMVKVLDFGIARTADSSLTVGGNMPGTPPFMSPEQCRGEDLDGRSDLYSLAVLMFLSVCGRLPFADRNMLKLMRMHSFEPPPDPRSYDGIIVSDELATVILRTLAKRPKDRPDTAAVMREALEDLRKGRFGESGMMIIPPLQLSGNEDAMSTIDLMDEPTKDSSAFPRPSIDPATIDIDFDDDIGPATMGARPHNTSPEADDEWSIDSGPGSAMTPGVEPAADAQTAPGPTGGETSADAAPPKGMDVKKRPPKKFKVTASVPAGEVEAGAFGDTRQASVGARQSSPAASKPAVTSSTPAEPSTEPKSPATPAITSTPEPIGTAAAGAQAAPVPAPTSAAPAPSSSGPSPLLWVLILAVIIGGVAAGVLLSGGTDKETGDNIAAAAGRAQPAPAPAPAPAKVNLQAQVAAEMARQESDPVKKLKHAKRAVELDPDNPVYKKLLDDALKAAETAATKQPTKPAAQPAVEPANAEPAPPPSPAKPAKAAAKPTTKRATRHAPAKPDGDKPPPRRVKPAILEE